MKHPVSGLHFTADLYGIEPEELSNMEKAHAFLNDLPDHIYTEKLGHPIVVPIPNVHKDYLQGITGFVILGESHISLHSWPENEYLSIDVYSCKEFDAGRVEIYVLDFWKPKKNTRFQTITRG